MTKRKALHQFKKGGIHQTASFLETKFLNKCFSNKIFVEAKQFYLFGFRRMFL